MEKDKTTKTLITFAILFILGAVFIGVMADQTILSTQKAIVADETTDISTSCLTDDGQVNTTNANCNITVTYAPTGWEQEDTDCYLSGVIVGNSTTALTLDTDYKLYASTGIVQLLNTTETTNTTFGNNLLVDYSYCGEGYMADSWGRSILNTNVGLFAIVLLIGAAAVIYILFGKER